MLNFLPGLLNYIEYAHALDDVRANTPGANGVVDVKSPGGKLPLNTDLKLYLLLDNAFYNV